MFHMEQFSKAVTILIVAALPYKAEAMDSALRRMPLPRQEQSSLSTSVRQPCFVDIPQIHDNAQATQLTNAALQELLLGDHDEAHRLLELSLEEEPRSILSHAAILATRQVTDSGEQQQHLQSIQRCIAEGSMLTPAEEAIIPWLLDLSRGENAAALTKIQAHTQRFRNDDFARCWEILLLHYASNGYDILGNSSPEQTHAEISAHILYTAKPDNALVCYIRALVEEGCPTPSPEACDAAKKSAQLLPGHPLPLQLCAHLLFRTGHYSAALEYLKEAASCTEQHLPVEGRAGETKSSERWILIKLYESSVLSTLHLEKQALALRRMLNAIPLATDEPTKRLPYQLLLRWEAHTLPLRVLFTSRMRLTTSRIKAATQAATLAPDTCLSSGEYHALNASRDCLEAALLSIVYARANNPAKAQEYLKLAETHKKKLQDLAPTSAPSPLLSRYLARQLEACAVAVIRAKSELHPEQDDVWQDAIRDATRAPSVLMPPVIPALPQRKSATIHQP